MKNQSLAKDYIVRAEKRLKALDTLFEQEAWSDVVCEAQKLVELALKGLLRSWNVEFPRIHDVSDILVDQGKAKAPAHQQTIEALSKISHELRRDRELAFYGSEDLTPSEFYKRSDAERARGQAKQVVREVKILFQVK